VTSCTIGVLALQGSVVEHISHLAGLAHVLPWKSVDRQTWMRSMA
jgi:glutamine amidotransferase PdxT